MTLDDTIERMYAAFAGQGKPAVVDACACCIGERELNELVRVDLRHLTAEQLSNYASSVFLTAGSDSDFRYFIPRILDLSLHGAFDWPDFEVICASLRNGEWLSWPESLKLSIIDVFLSAWERAATGGDGVGVDSLICGFGRAGLDLYPFLGRLEAADAERALVGFYDRNSQALMKGKLRNEFWGDFKAEAAPVIAWFGSPGVVQIVNRHYGLA
jgi:hypothetical protein